MSRPALFRVSLLSEVITGALNFELLTNICFAIYTLRCNKTLVVIFQDS